MKKPVIYKIINTENGKFYVGSTLDTRERFRTHRCKLRANKHHCAHLQAAWNKYGEPAFVFKVVEEVETIEALQAAEDVWLTTHYGKAHCYNTGRRSDAPWRGIAKEQHPCFGRKKELGEKAQIAKGVRAFYVGHDGPRKGAKLSDEEKALMRARMLGRFAREKHYRYGKTVSAEVREKIGAAQRGVKKAPRVISEEGMAKIRAAADAGHYSHGAGKKRPEEVVAKSRKSVVAVDPDGVLTPFSSIQELRQQLGLPPGTVNNALKAGAPLLKGRYAGWRFMYEGGSLAPLPPPLTLPAEFAEYPRSRAEAKARGLDRYFTGTPCINGHVALRKTKGVCTECSKQQDNARNERKKALATSSKP